MNYKITKVIKTEERPLNVVIPCLSLSATDCIAKVSKYMSLADDQFQWSLIFRRNLTEELESEFVSLLETLSQVAILDIDGDKRVWRASKTGAF